MTLADRWLLPEGVDEALPIQAEKIEHCRRVLLNLHHSWGYQLVIPPLLEYLDSLLTGAGSDLDNETFKVIDQLSGRLLGIRADFTSQVARIDAHCLKGEGVQRLCYCGSVLRTMPAGLDGTRSPIQLGAELYGHGGLESDIEMVSLMLETLAAVGIKHPVVDFGHVDIVQGVLSACGLNAEQRETLSAYYKAKDLPELDNYVRSLNLPEQQAYWLIELPKLCGDKAVLQRAKVIFSGLGRLVLDAIDQLDVISQVIALRYPAVRWHFDLSDLVSYNYHTGLVFAAYLSDYGNAIARGGRYNNIGEVFGRPRPATGFSTDLKALVALSELTLQPVPTVMAPASIDDVLLWQKISALRAQGYSVIQALDGAEVIKPVDFNLVCINGDWQLVAVNQ